MAYESEILAEKGVAKALLLGGVFLAVMFVAYMLTEPILAFYQELPVDDYEGLVGVGVVKLDDRVKQAWAWMYTPVDGGVMEVGCGSGGLVAINLDKRGEGVKGFVHHVLMPGGEIGQLRRKMLERNKEVCGCTFAVLEEPLALGGGKMYFFETVVVHMDGVAHFCSLMAKMPFLLDMTSCVLVETRFVKDIKVVLEALGFEKVRRYFYLSLWVRKKPLDVARQLP